MSSAAETERFRLAVEAGAEITAALAGDDAPTVIVRRVAQALDAWECDLYEYDPETRTLTAAALWARELTDEDLAWVGTTISLDERPGYVPIIEGGACALSGVDDPDLDPADRAAMLAWGETATLAVPLHFRDRGVVGCLTLIEKREGRRFTDEDCELVVLLAGPAAVAVCNARLFRLQQEQNRHLSSLLDTGRAITSAVTLEDSLTSICRTAAAALETEECIAYEYDAGRDAIVCRAFWGVHGTPPALDERGVYPLDDYPTDREILRRGEVVQETLSDASLAADVRASMEQWGEKACLNVPLIVEGERLGILVLIETERERTFGASEVELARALGEQAATSIRHARLYRRGERQNRAAPGAARDEPRPGLFTGRRRRARTGAARRRRSVRRRRRRRGDAAPAGRGVRPLRARSGGRGRGRRGGGRAGRAPPPRRRRARRGALRRGRGLARRRPVRRG